MVRKSGKEETIVPPELIHDFRTSKRHMSASRIGQRSSKVGRYPETSKDISIRIHECHHAGRSLLKHKSNVTENPFLCQYYHVLWNSHDELCGILEKPAIHALPWFTVFEQDHHGNVVGY